jgi:L-threonylcarbamoyladenylate synthase
VYTLLTDDPLIAAQFIRDGKIVAFPTETVYGLGANIFDVSAVLSIFTAKGRPDDNPLIAHICELADLPQLTANVTKSAAEFIKAFFPGPLTVILPKHENVPVQATGGLDTIGIRMPSHPLALDFIRACGVPLVAPSANLSGKPSPTSWASVRDDLDGRIPCILKGEPTQVGLESTVVDCTTEVPVILRAGAVTLEQLRKVNPATKFANRLSGEPARSPGMKYKHYAPQAKVIVIDRPDSFIHEPEAAFIGLHPVEESNFKRIFLAQDISEYSRAVFQFFRDCDAEGIKIIYCEAVEEAGLGVALMDRIRRASYR